MKNYEAPEVQIIKMEVCDVIATSQFIDVPEKLTTWGSAVGVNDSNGMSFFD